MRVSVRRFCVSGAVAVAVLGGCGGHSATRIASRPPAPTMTTTTTLVPPGFGRWVDDINRAKWFAGLGKIAAAVNRAQADKAATASPKRLGPAVASPVNIGTATSASIASVMACIKRHESGDYTEHSHITDGSGAYQFIPSTWRAWEIRAGFSHQVKVKNHWVTVANHEYAYLAPPSVQDAVVIYTLTHGGAGNWSPRYGNDPCTRGLPDGG